MNQSSYREPIPQFPLGHLVATPGALQVLEQHGIAPMQLIARHRSGDWGDIDPGDAKTNAQALRVGARILSSYRLANGEKIWIITEADRAATTILLSSEY
jgi:hypothetical protein